MNKKIIAEIAKIEKIKEKEIAAAEAKAEKAKAIVITPILKELKDLLDTLKEVAPKELEDTIRNVIGLSLNTTVDNTTSSSNIATTTTTTTNVVNTNTATSNASNTSVSNVNTSTTVFDSNNAIAASSEVMQEAFDKGSGKKTRRSKKASAAEKAQKRAEKKAQDEAEALSTAVPEKYKEVMKVMYRSKKICRGFYKGVPFSAGVNVGGVMVFNPLRYDLEAEIEKVLLDCNFIDPKDLTKDPYKVRESYGSVQKLRSGDYCGYVVGSNGFISLFIKSINKERPCIMGLPSFMEGDTKPHASHDSFVSLTIKELIAAHTANNPNAAIAEPVDTVADTTTEPYSVGRDDSSDLDMDFGEEDFATAEDFEYDY